MKLREQPAVRIGFLHALQAQPLNAKLSTRASARGSASMRRTSLLEHRRILAAVPAAASLSSALVRSAAPQEVRQPRGQLRDRRCGSSCRRAPPAGVRSKRKTNFGFARIACTAMRMPFSKPPSLPALLVVAHQNSVSASRRRPAERLRAPACAMMRCAHGGSSSRRRRRAGEDLAAARRVRHAGHDVNGPATVIDCRCGSAIRPGTPALMSIIDCSTWRN